jgi:glycosidase
VAGQYFWHRFFSHQPDLNFDNPAVREAVFGVMEFWLDKGVDGFRLDAIPYLIEREGTSNENLRETHAVIKELRRGWTPSTATSCCWPKPTCGPKTCASTSARATNATWPTTFR